MMTFRADISHPKDEEKMANWEMSAWVQCHFTKRVDFRFPKQKITVANRLNIGKGSPINKANKDIK